MSIYARPEDKHSRDNEAVRQLEQETKHLKKRASTRFGAGHRTSLGQIGAFLSVIFMLGLWLMDPIVCSFERANAIDAYIYLSSRNEQTYSQSLYSSFYFDGVDQVKLKNHQSFGNNLPKTFPDIESAKKTAQDCLAFQDEVFALKKGDLAHLDTFGIARYYLFYKWGINAPVPLVYLNTSVEGFQLFKPTKKKDDPNDVFANM